MAAGAGSLRPIDFVKPSSSTTPPAEPLLSVPITTDATIAKSVLATIRTTDVESGAKSEVPHLILLDLAHRVSRYVLSPMFYISRCTTDSA